jgi:hypothetical protein
MLNAEIQMGLRLNIMACCVLETGKIESILNTLIYG